MNASRLMSWLRRHSWRRENQPAATRQRIIYAPEILEPRTVLSAMSLYVPDADERPLDGGPGRGDAPTAEVRENLAPYATNGEYARSSLDRPILSLSEDGSPSLEPPTRLPQMTQPQGGFRPAKVTIDTEYVAFMNNVSVQFTTIFILPYASRDSWTSNTGPSGPRSSGVPSPDAVGSASDEAEGEESDYGRTFIAASASSFPSAVPVNVMADAWWSSMTGMPATTPERGNLANSGAAESQEQTPTYSRGNASGSLLADELTTHLVHAEEAHSTRTSTSLIASPLATTSTALTDAARHEADDADARLADSWLAGKRGDLRGDGESDGMIDLDGAGTLRRGRRLPTSPAMQTSGVNPRLARLTDLALMRDAPSLMRALAQIARDALFSADQSFAAGSSGHADEPMLDLLAADVGTLRQSTAASAPATAAPAASRPLSLEAGVALYQAFDLASNDASEAAAASEGRIASSPSAAEATVAMREE